MTLCLLVILIVFHVLSKHVDLNLRFGLKVMELLNRSRELAVRQFILLENLDYFLVILREHFVFVLVLLNKLLHLIQKLLVDWRLFLLLLILVDIAGCFQFE